MQNQNIHHSGGIAEFIDNDRYDDLDFTTGLREFKPSKNTRQDWRTIAVIIFGGLVCFVVFTLIYFSWKIVYCWNAHYSTCATLDATEPQAFGLVFIIVLTTLLYAALSRIKAHYDQQRAIARRTNLVLDRFGDQVPADLFERLQTPQMLDYLMQRYLIANELQRTIAPHQQYKGVNVLSLTSGHQSEAFDDVLDNTTLQPILPGAWLPWIDQRPHVILAAATGEGKTTTAKAILAPRINAGEHVFVIDPHSDHWFDLPIMGGGENWAEVKDAIQTLYEEYVRRMQERDQYLQQTNTALAVSHFKRLTILFDEGNNARLQLDRARRGEVSAWDQFVQVLGSGARKVNMSVILLLQSANVEDIGLSGSMRRNFTRIALDAATIRLMITQDEKDAERRRMLYTSIVGMQYPATTEIDARIELLDRAGLDRMATITMPIERCIWRPSGAGSTISGRNQPLQTDGRNNNAGLHAMLHYLRSKGISREDARLIYGLEFSNEDWSI